MGILDGKVAIVTGAGQGVGKGIAEALAEAGATLMLSGRTLSKVARVADELAAKGARVKAMHADVMKAEDIEANVAQTVEAFGGIDILINNAQTVYTTIPLLETTDKMFDEMYQSGPLASFRYMKACHPHMKTRGGGAIVNFATASSQRWDMAGYGPYAGVKQCIRSLTRAAAAEWGKDNIRINTIAPFSLTPALEEWQKFAPEDAAKITAEVALGRIGDPKDDIGRAVVFLVGPDSHYLTGSTMPLDGGMANFG